MFKCLAIFLFTVGRWKLKGRLPDDVEKCIVVGAPHTSNLDLLIAMGGFYKMKLPIRFLIKKEWLRRFPLKNILLSAGALGVDRTKHNTMVDAIADVIRNTNQRMAVLITPEGTRKRACKWKTGFYYTALKAEVPIYLSHLDYSKKEAVFGPGFMPGGDFKADMQILKEHYRDVTPRYPENFCLDIYLDESENNRAEQAGRNN